MAGITILNHEFDIDFCDCEVLERYEQAMEMLRAEQNAKYSSAAARMTGFCTLINECMDRVMGEGTSKLLFGKKMNFRNSTEAMVQLISAQKAASDEVNAMISDMNRTVNGSTANSEGNREQRRAAAQSKHQGKKGKKQNYPRPAPVPREDEE